MTTNRYKYRFQLQDKGLGGVSAGPSIIGSGGVVKVCLDGSPLKAAITDKDGTALTNPRALTRGSCEFYSTEDYVDLFIQCPDGQFVTVWNVSASELNEIPVDRYARDQVMVIPVHITDFPAAVETDTGFDEPPTSVVTADAVAFRVTVVDATETLDVGTATADSGDPDGFISAVDVATAGVVRDNGALFSSGAGHTTGTKSIVVTTTAGSDTVEGYAFLPYTLLNINVPTLSGPA